MIKKKQIISLVSVAVASFLIGTMFSVTTVAKKDGGNPFDKIWEAIQNLQSQIDEIEPIPGPPGPMGPQGPKGDKGDPGPPGECMCTSAARMHKALWVIDESWVRVISVNITLPETSDLLITFSGGAYVSWAETRLWADCWVADMHISPYASVLTDEMSQNRYSLNWIAEDVNAGVHEVFIRCVIVGLGVGYVIDPTLIVLAFPA